jgi:DNA-binding PucR family transcriptional regulator
MTGSIQEAIDALAERLGRPVGVDDRRFGAVAYSSHEHEIDPVRRISILGRRAPSRVTAWLDTLDLMRAADYVRVPARPDLEMVARICFPLRFHERVLGFLWLVEHGSPVTDHELDVTRESAVEIAEVLFGLQQQRDDVRLREAAAVRQLTSGAGSSPRGDLAAAPVYAAVVVAIVEAGRPLTGREIDVRVTEALDHARRTVSTRHQLASVGEGGATVLLACSTSEESAGRATALVELIRAGLIDVPEAEVVAGVGFPCGEQEELPEAYRQAVLAARIGRAIPTMASPILWEELRAYRLIAELVGDRDPATMLPEPLRRLLADQDSQLLLTTLSAYLEHAGDAAATAAELFVHRSSLYNRLRRIEEISGRDLRSGADRLELHLGLRLWLLAGGEPAAVGKRGQQQRV